MFLGGERYELSDWLQHILMQYGVGSGHIINLYLYVAAMRRGGRLDVQEHTRNARSRSLA